MDLHFHQLASRRHERGSTEHWEASVAGKLLFEIYQEWVYSEAKEQSGNPYALANPYILVWKAKCNNMIDTRHLSREGAVSVCQEHWDRIESMMQEAFDWGNSGEGWMPEPYQP